MRLSDIYIDEALENPGIPVIAKRQVKFVRMLSYTLEILLLKSPYAYHVNELKQLGHLIPIR